MELKVEMNVVITVLPESQWCATIGEAPWISASADLRRAVDSKHENSNDESISTVTSLSGAVIEDASRNRRTLSAFGNEIPSLHRD